MSSSPPEPESKRLAPLGALPPPGGRQLQPLGGGGLAPQAAAVCRRQQAEQETGAGVRQAGGLRDARGHQRPGEDPAQEAVLVPGRDPQLHLLFYIRSPKKYGRDPQGGGGGAIAVK